MSGNKGELQVSTATQMLQTAIANNASIDTLERLIALKERYEEIEARKAFNKALAEFRASSIVIKKDKRVKYDKRDGSKVDYRHATLANVIAVTSPILGKYGLAATWKTVQTADVITVTCRITHEMGHFEETSLSAKPDDSGNKNPIQAMGSTVSYLERYTYMAILGLSAANQDNDANGGGEDIPPARTQGKSAPQKKDRKDAQDADFVPPGDKKNECHGCGEIVSDKVADYSRKKFGKPLCMTCQKNPPKGCEAK